MLKTYGSFKNHSDTERKVKNLKVTNFSKCKSVLLQLTLPI